MTGKVEYLPGTRAMLIYTDERGTERSSIVEIITRRVIQDVSTYVVRARSGVMNLLIRQVPTTSTNTSVEEGWVLGVVQADALRPLSQRNFTLVK